MKDIIKIFNEDENWFDVGQEAVKWWGFCQYGDELYSRVREEKYLIIWIIIGSKKTLDHVLTKYQFEIAKPAYIFLSTSRKFKLYEYVYALGYYSFPVSHLQQRTLLSSTFESEPFLILVTLHYLTTPRGD
jgi:phage terminase large subunit